MKCDVCGEEGHATEEFGNKLGILQYIHCRLCFEELPRGKSMEDYSRYSIGMTKQGFQVWCRRHDCNVLHIDLQGHKHPADMTRHLDA